ncbi:MAG TPA: HNH endonuclease, partial [Mycobacterium sp.]|nr:HNH endonuclease [Mycobacterium sp.]
TYITNPGGAVFFPRLAHPTGELHLPDLPVSPPGNRGLMMPTRSRTRVNDQARRRQWERGRQQARIAAQAAEVDAAAHLATSGNDPPPF